MNSKDLGPEFDSEREKNFYHNLRERVNEYIDDKVGEDKPYADYVLLAPDLFYLLYKLSTDERVPSRYRLELIGTIAYFIMPVDLIPEALVGPIGFADDVVLGCYVLNRVLNDVEDRVIRGHWPGEKDILEQIRQVLDVADEWIGEKQFKRIKDWLDSFFDQRSGPA